MGNFYIQGEICAWHDERMKSHLMRHVPDPCRD
jgi:hypothetical protein